jgi:hypothetical protein
MADKKKKGKNDKFIWGKDDKIQIFDPDGKEIHPEKGKNEGKKKKKTSSLLEEVRHLAETLPETREALLPLIRGVSQGTIEDD